MFLLFDGKHLIPETNIRFVRQHADEIVVETVEEEPPNFRVKGSLDDISIEHCGWGLWIACGDIGFLSNDFLSACPVEGGVEVTLVTGVMRDDRRAMQTRKEIAHGVTIEDIASLLNTPAPDPGLKKIGRDILAKKRKSKTKKTPKQPKTPKLLTDNGAPAVVPLDIGTPVSDAAPKAAPDTTPDTAPVDTEVLAAELDRSRTVDLITGASA